MPQRYRLIIGSGWLATVGLPERNKGAEAPFADPEVSDPLVLPNAARANPDIPWTMGKNSRKSKKFT